LLEFSWPRRRTTAPVLEQLVALDFRPRQHEPKLAGAQVVVDLHDLIDPELRDGV
jgi:hypothetical protein